MKKIYVFLLPVLLFPLILSALECKVCKKRVYGKYVVSSNKEVFCSRKCFLKTLPNCAKCGKVCEKGGYTLMEKSFCSRKCMQGFFRCAACGKGMEKIVTLQDELGKKILVCPQCNAAPRCYFCSMPGAKTRLPDKRTICRKCNSSAVKSPQEVENIFKKVRSDINKWFGFDNAHSIELHIVNLQELHKLSSELYRPEGSKQLAMMRYQVRIKQKLNRRGEVKKEIKSGEICRIYVLSHIPRNLLKDTFAHELTHDHLRHNIGKVKELADEEGFCELTASLYNAKTGNLRINKQKEANPDKIYGNGFRKMRKLYIKNGKNLKKTMEYLK